MSDEYWEIVEYKCQDGECLMIHNIPNDSKLGALSLDHRDIGEAIVDLLNELYEENEQLKQSNDRFADTVAKQVSLLIELRKENEQLKKENKGSEEDVTDYHNALFDLHKKFDKLEKENEQLRKLLREAEDEIETLKKSNQSFMESLVNKESENEDNQETEVRECSFCGEFRTEYHDPDCYGGWTSEDFCNAGHDLEDTNPNSCKDYWDKF